VTLDWSIIGDTKELDILGAHCSGLDGYTEAIELISSGMVPIDKIVTDTLPLEDVVRGIDMVNACNSSSIKVSLDPWL